MRQLTPDSQGKLCRDCGELKPLDEFTLSKKNRDGRGSYCRDCFNVRDRAYRQKRAQAEGRPIKQRRVAPEGQKWCPTCAAFRPVDEFPKNRSNADGLAAYCKPCHNARGKETYTRLYGSTREYHLRRRYGITGAEFDAMVEAQGGTCAVCDGKPEHVDHDHKTGKVRGVLCFNCNQALGNVRDDVVVLDALIRYLSDHRLSLLRLAPPDSPLEDVVFEVACRHLSA